MVYLRLKSGREAGILGSLSRPGECRNDANTEEHRHTDTAFGETILLAHFFVSSTIHEVKDCQRIPSKHGNTPNRECVSHSLGCHSDAVLHSDSTTHIASGTVNFDSQSSGMSAREGEKGPDSRSPRDGIWEVQSCAHQIDVTRDTCRLSYSTSSLYLPTQNFAFLFLSSER